MLGDEVLGGVVRQVAYIQTIRHGDSRCFRLQVRRSSPWEPGGACSCDRTAATSPLTENRAAREQKTREVTQERENTTDRRGPVPETNVQAVYHEPGPCPN